MHMSNKKVRWAKITFHCHENRIRFPIAKKWKKWKPVLSKEAVSYFGESRTRLVVDGEAVFRLPLGFTRFPTWHLLSLGVWSAWDVKHLHLAELASGAIRLRESYRFSFLTSTAQRSEKNIDFLIPLPPKCQNDYAVWDHLTSGTISKELNNIPLQTDGYRILHSLAVNLKIFTIIPKLWFSLEDIFPFHNSELRGVSESQLGKNTISLTLM